MDGQFFTDLIKAIFGLGGDELFGCLSRKPPEPSGLNRYPACKGQTEGVLVIGYVK